MTKQGSVWTNFRQFDVYAKTLDDFRVKTAIGATVTLASAFLIAILTFSELVSFSQPVWNTNLVVDHGRKEKLTINFNVTFPHMPCHMLSLDIMDESGKHISGYTHDVYKTRLDMMGIPIDTEKEYELGDKSHGAIVSLEPSSECGSCYGATPQREDGCCHTCADVREAYAKMGWGLVDTERIDQCQRENWKELFEKHSNEGCNINGRLSVNKVTGNFHIAPGHAFSTGRMHIHDLKTYYGGAPDGHHFDLTHHIHLLTFGPDTGNQYDANTQTATNSLANTYQVTDHTKTSFQYFLKIVATEMRSLNGRIIYTNQYSATMSERQLGHHGHGLPGVFFMMNISPMLIIYQESRKSFGAFITGVFAIIGGILTISGILVRFIRRAETTLKKSTFIKTQ